MKRIGNIRIGFLLLLGISLSACVGEGMLRFPAATPVPYPPPGYAHRVGTPQVGLFYNCINPEPGVLRLEGIAFNIWSAQPVRFLEFELAGVSAQERTVSETVGEARDIQIFTGQNSPFQMDLRMTGGEQRYDLYYQYQFGETNPERPIAGPMVTGAFPRHHGNRFLVRDACSPTQHLFR